LKGISCLATAIILCPFTNCFQNDKRRSIDLDLCRQQHAGVVEALRANGIDVLELPPEEANPLSVFTQVSNLGFILFFCWAISYFRILPLS